MELHVYKSSLYKDGQVSVIGTSLCVRKVVQIYLDYNYSYYNNCLGFTGCIMTCH